MQWQVLRGEGRIDLPVDGHPLTGPRRRTWSAGRLVSDQAVSAHRTPTGFAFDGSAEVDVLVGPPPEPPPALTVLGSFELMDAARFLVGGQVVDTVLGVPSEQTALQVWRIARHAGGAYWDGVASVVAEWVAGRLGQPHGDLTHTRFVADGVLLLAATGQDRTDALEPLRVGDWFVHDDHDDGSDHVLNTHVLAMVARLAAGAPPVGVDRLHAALRAPRGARAWAHAVDTLAGDLAAGWAPRQRAFTGHTHAADVRAARQRQRDRTLVLPSGRTGRDSRGEPAAAYHTVNVADLASYALSTGDPLVRKASDAGATYALRSGHWRGLLRDRQPIVLLVPPTLLRLGRPDLAERWARRLERAGFTPALGWPGFVDDPWERLPAGTL